MTNHVTSPRRKRSAVLSLLAVLSMFATLLVAAPAGANEISHTIMEVQGSAHLSELDGETVTTSGIVTAVAFRSFYMQDPNGDGDDNTSDGIFVRSDSSVEVGQEVEVTGEVSEAIGGGPATGNLSVTTLNAVGDPSVLSEGNALPAPVEIGRNGRRPGTDIVISDSELPTNLQEDAAVFNPDVDAIDFYETLEGMYVEVDRPIATSATRQFSNFSAEFFTVPSLGQTVSPANARSQRGGILLQADPDNTGDQNPERVQIQFDGTIYPADFPVVNVGDRMDDVRGVVGYSFGNYEVNATEELNTRSVRLRPQTSRLNIRRDRVNVASYNILNVSPDDSDAAQRAKLADQIVNQLRTPDVIALQEVQDNSGQTNDGVTAADETLQAMIDEIVAAGGPTYTFLDVAPADGAFGGVPGGNIRNSFLYNADRVELLDFVSLSPGLLAQLGAANPDAFAGSRSPLAGLFSFNDTPFTVVNVHNTSRFGSTPIFGGPQPFVQAGEQAREDQAEALNVFADTLLADSDDAIVMITGDFNTFEWTNDLAEILPGEDGALVNLMTASALNSQDRGNRYTFIFDGNSQALDHFFVTENLKGSRSELDIVHTNVDFTRMFGDVTASDHEPLTGRFRLPASSGPLELPDAPVVEEGLTLQLLHASDLEGGVDALDRAANFAAIVDALEDTEDADASVTISAGDNYIPGPFFGASGDRSLRSVFQDVYNELNGRDDLTNIRESPGRGDITIMNIIEFDASALGNHEFDAGTDAIATIIGQDVRGTTPGDLRWTGADFPYLSSNLDFSADGSLSDLFTSDILENTSFAATAEELLGGATPPKIAPSAIITVDGGEQIGVVGATTPLLPQISSPGDTTVVGPTGNDMAALAAVIQPEISALEDLGINKIILTTHLQQLALEEELATLLDGVDIIIAGGSDSLLANDDDPLRTGDVADREYPVQATSGGGEPVAIVSTDGEYSYVGRLVVEFDGNGVLVGDTDPAVNGPIKTETEDVEGIWGTDDPFADGTKGGLVGSLVDAISGVVTAKDGNVVGETSVYLDGRRSQVRTEETNFGNLSADANLAVAQAFDESVAFSLKNGGGIRAAIGEINTAGDFLPPQANPATGKLDGQVSQLDIENTLRFNNNLVLLDVTAAELVGLVEHAVAATAPGATPGQFGQIGGGTYVYDVSAAPGSRIVTFALLDGANTTVVVSDGELQVPDDTVYRIVTLGFLAGGGDGYPFPDTALPSTNFVALDGVLTDDGAFTFAAAGTEQDALAEFMAANHGIGAGTPFDQAETPIDQDSRIVELSFAD